MMKATLMNKFQSSNFFIIVPDPGFRHYLWDELI